MTKIIAPFSEAAARHIYPAMARQGLRRKGKRTWWERREDGSRVVLEIQMRGITRTELGFTVNTAAWPPGTWEHQRTRMSFLTAEEVPYASGAPVWQRPRGVAPQLWPCEDDFRYVDPSTDIERVVAELRDFLLAASDWARERSDVEGALDAGLDDYWAIAMLHATVPDDPRLAVLQGKYGLAVEPGPASGPAATGD